MGMHPKLVSTAVGGLAALALGCGRDSHAAMHSAVETREAPPMRGACDHAVCGSHYFVDAMPVAGCPISMGIPEPPSEFPAH